MQRSPQQSHTVLDRTSGRQILLIDEEDEIRSVLRTILEERGLRVQTAAGGREGIDLARRLTPDVIVMDLVLPDVNGFDAAVALRNDERTASIPLIAATASWLGSELDRLKVIGFAGALRKPFTGEALFEELSKHLAA